MDIAAIRADIPLLNECLYFNTGGIAPAPSVVTDALVADFTDISRHGPPLIMDPAANGERISDARRRIAALLGVDADDLCLTRGVSDGVTLVFNGIDWREGDEMIITDEEHPAVKVPAERISATCGVIIKQLPVAGGAEAILRRLREMITPRTRLMAVSHVTTDTGTRLPAADLCRLAHERDIPVMIDGAQSLGQFPVDVPSLGADFYGFLSYKWLFGPYSTGGMYIEKSWQKRLKYVVPGTWHGQQPASARQFENGPMSQPLYYGTATAIDYIQGIGIAEISTRMGRLSSLLRDGLKAVPGVVIHSPDLRDTAPGIVAFSVDGMDGRDLNTGLRARKIVTRPALLKFSGVRVSPAFFNTEEEVEMVARAVAEIAAST